MSNLTPGILTKRLDTVAKNLKGIAKLKVKYRPLICPLHLILDEIPQNVTCFDVGCGSGTLLWLIEQYKNPAKLGGVEISEKLISDARSLLPNHSQELNTYNGTDLPASILNYDVVILNDVFHHIPPDQQAPFLQNLKEKMRPHARFIFKDIDADRPILTLGNKLHDLVLAGEVGHEISKSHAENLLTQAGFKVEHSYSHRMLWYPHFTVLARS